MKLKKHVVENFDQIWNDFCMDGSGHMVLEKENFSTDTKVPILWKQDKNKGLKVLVIIVPHNEKMTPHVFVNVDESKLENFPKSRTFPLHVKEKYTKVGNFRFTKDELLPVNAPEEAWEQRLKVKYGKIGPDCFTKIEKSLRTEKRKKRFFQPVHSVRAMPTAFEQGKRF